MKLISKLLCVIVIVLARTGLGADYSPVVQIIGDGNASSSGVVYKEANGLYYIVGAAHNPPKTVTLFGTVGKSKTAFNVGTKVLASDTDIDLVHCTVEKFDWIEVKPIPISKGSLTPGQKSISLGYVTGGDLLKNDVVVIDYTSYRTLGGAQILSCSGKRIFGLSGGPLTFNNEVYGIQSSGSTDTVLYCPADQVLRFIENDQN